MAWGSLLAITAVLGAMLLVVQRSDPTRRRFTFIVMLVGFEVVRRYVVFRDWETEGWIALAAALVINGLFWVFFGRSNPPHSGDEIEVLGNE